MKFKNLSLIPNTIQYGAVGKLATYSVLYDNKLPELKWSVTFKSHDKRNGQFETLADYIETKELAFAVAEKHEANVQ